MHPSFPTNSERKCIFLQKSIITRKKNDGLKSRNEKSLLYYFRKIYGQIVKADPSSYCYTEFREINFVRDQWPY